MKKTNNKNNKATNKKTTKKQPRYGISHPDLFHHSRWHVHLNLWQVVSPVVHAPKFGVALVKGLHRRQKNLILKGRTPDVIDLNGGYQHQGRNVWQLKKITEGEFICQSWSFKNLQVAQFPNAIKQLHSKFPYIWGLGWRIYRQQKTKSHQFPAPKSHETTKIQISMSPRHWSLQPVEEEESTGAHRRRRRTGTVHRVTHSDSFLNGYGRFD